MANDTNTEMMQMFKDAIERSRTAQYRSGAQSAIGAANAIGGVYGHNLQADTALSGQTLQHQVGMENVGVNQGQLALETKKAFMPAPGDMGTSGSRLGVGTQPINIGDINKRIDEIMGGK